MQLAKPHTLQAVDQLSWGGGGAEVGDKWGPRAGGEVPEFILQAGGV